MGNTGDDLIEVCNNYYVHDFSISNEEKNIEPNNKVIVSKITLHCYSPDKLLTLDKYSRVYCGDTFRSKLFNAMEYKPQGLDLDYNVDNIMNAKIYDKSHSLSEIRFPFLVQYNESFYDFLRRIAVRCGEYLFYEDGKLTLGIPDHTKPETEFVTSGINVKYPHVTLSDTNDTEVKLVTNNIIFPEVEKEEEKNEESFPSYNMEYTNDDFQKVVGKKDNNKIYNGMYAWEKFTYGALGAALTKATNAETAVSSIVSTYVSAIADAGINRRYLKDDFEDEAEEYANSVGLLPSGGLMNSFYYEIEKIEENAQKNTVELDYSSTIPNLKLGKAVDLKDGLADFYTVTHVYGEITPDNVRSNRVEIVPTTKMVKTYKKKKKQDDEEVEEFVTEQIPVPIPPHYDIPRIRKAEAQEAVVKDVKDPYLLGRVRVQFLWQIDKETEKIKIYLNDKEEEIEKNNFSPWLRVTVPYVGGNQGGMNMMPEKDDHLMVNFVGGNVDMPYIEGFMATRATMPSSGSGLVKNKLDPSFKRKVIASSKGHSITFTDITDRSSIFNMLCPPIEAFVNMARGIEKQFEGKTDSWGIDENWAPFTGGITLRDPNGVYELDLSAKNRSINVKSPFGNVNISAFTGITIDAPNGDINIRGKNVNIEAGNNLTLTSGTNIRNKDFSYKELGLSALAAGLTGAVSIAETAIGAAAPWTKEFAKLADVSFLRSSWEIIVRPVEGSLKLQSKRNTIITAGNSKVYVPKNTISDGTVLNLKEKKFVKINEEISYKYIISSVIIEHDSYFSVYYSNLMTMKQIVSQIGICLWNNVNAYNNNFKNEYKLLVNDDEAVRDRFVVIIRKIINNEELSEWAEVRETNANANNKTAHDNCVKDFKSARRLYEKILGTKDKFIKDIKDIIEKDNAEHSNSISTSTSFLDGLWVEKTLFDLLYEENDYLLLRNINDNDFETKKKKSRRKLLYNLIMSGFDGRLISLDSRGEPIVYNVDNGNNDNWQNYVGNLRFIPKIPTPNPFGAMVDKLTLGVTNFSQYGLDINAIFTGNYGKLFNINGSAGPRALWEASQKGKILVSNNSANTMSLNDTSDSWVSSPNPDLSAIKTLLGYTPQQNPPQNNQQQDNQQLGN